MPTPLLSFIKLQNVGNPNGSIEAHWDNLQHKSYKRTGDYTSDFSVLDANNGVWQLFSGKLGFVKLKNVGNQNGSVEVHWDTLQHNSYKRTGDYTSDFSVLDANNGVWQLVNVFYEFTQYPNSPATGGTGVYNPPRIITLEELAPMLGFIKIRNVQNPAGMVEVHLDQLHQSGTYQRGGADYISDFSTADANNGVWQLLSGGPNDAPSLVFIKLRNVQNPAGVVEVHWAKLQNGIYKFDGHYTTDFSTADAGNGSWQVDDRTGHLVFIKSQNVQNPAGMIEIHFDELKGNTYQRLGNDYVSDFSTSDASNGVWLAT